MEASLRAKGVGKGGRAWVPNDRAVFENRPNQRRVEANDCSRRRVVVEVAKDHAKNFAGFRTGSINVGGAGER